MKLIYTIICILLSGSFLSAQKAVNVSNSSTVSSEIKGTTLLGSVVINNLEMLNSSDMDYSPILFQGGVVFTSTRKYKGKETKLFSKWKKEYSYLFFAKRNKRGDFRTPEPLKGKINGRYHEGAACFNKEGNLMFFTRNTNEGKNSFGKINLKIFLAKNIKGQWKEIQDLPFNSDRHSTCHPSISKDGKRLYFASNKNGGYGGMDIYVSHLVDGKWQYPVNLGEEVNSSGNETFPFIDDSDELYFSSDGHGGKGGLDIFKTTFADAEKESWNPIENVGSPFNSEKDDFGFTVYNNGQEGYFTSSREGGKGRDDIYTWRKAYIPQADELDLENRGHGMIDAVDPLQKSNAQEDSFALIADLFAVLVDGEE